MAQINGEDLMAHQPNTVIADSTQSEKTRVAKSATPPSESHFVQKKLSRPTKINTGALDSKLRAAKTNLQDNPNDGNQDFAESMGGNLGNIDKIRDLLFGGQMRDYDKRFKLIEERINQENIHFREDMFQRIKVLEERIGEEIEHLSEKAKMARQEHQSAAANLEDALKSLKKELNNRITQLNDQFSKNIKNLRQQTHNKIQELAMQIRQQNDSLVGLFNQEVAKIQEEKVNRSDLAAFFNELAVRLHRGDEGKNKESKESSEISL